MRFSRWIALAVGLMVSVVGGPAFALTANSPSGNVGDTLPPLVIGGNAGPVTFSTFSSTCTVASDGTMVLTHVGTCTVRIFDSGINSTFTRAVPVGKGTNVINYPQPSDASYGATVYLNADSSSGLPVVYVSNSASICAVDPSGTVTFSNIGRCSITVSSPVPASNPDYNTAAPIEHSFNVNKGQNTITFPAPDTAVSNLSPPALNAISSTGGSVTYVSKSLAICTVTSGGNLTFIGNGGTCKITASSAATSLYVAAADVTITFEVLNGTNLITFPVLADTPYNLTPPALLATTNSRLPVNYASNSTAVCTVSGNTIAFHGLRGACSITASQAGNGSVTPAISVTQTFNVTGKVNAITFTLPSSAVTWGQTPPTLSATALSGGPVDFTSAGTSVCTVSGTNVITLTGRGRCQITASADAYLDFGAATSVIQSFNVVGLPNSITFPRLSNTSISNTAPALLATATATPAASYPITYTSNTTGVCNVTGSVLTLQSQGACSITATQPGDAGYVAALPVTQTFLVQSPITPGQNVITFPALAATPFASTPPVLAASAGSGLPVSYTSNTLSTCTVSAGLITFVSAGSCSITANQAGRTTAPAFPAASPVTQSFNIIGTANAISFITPPATPFTSTPPVLSTVATSTKPVTFASNTTTICTVTSSGVITFKAVGLCSITASQLAAGAYVAPANVTVAFDVTRGVNLITFPVIGPVAATGPPPVLAATASSGLPVAYSSNSTEVCSITSGALTINKVGTCSITAAQAGNTTYLTAASVTRSFNVTPGAPTSNVIAFTPTGPAPLTSPPPTLGATASSGLSVSYASNASNICTVTPAGVLTLVAGGSCSITASQVGDGTYPAATPVTVSFMVTTSPLATNVITFPQPANADLSGTAPALNATATSGLTVTYISTSPSVCTVTTAGVITMVSAGTCAITAHQAGSTTVLAATDVSVTLLITAGTNVISFQKPANTAFTSTPPPLVASASSGGAVSYSTNAPLVCSVASAGTVSFNAGGTCSITATQPGTTKFAAAASVTQTFQVLPGANTITFAQPSDAVVTGAAPGLVAAASSSLPLSYTTASTACTVTPTGYVSLVAPGPCAITASQAGNASYAAAAPVTRTFAVTTGANTISFTQPVDTPFTSAPPTLVATATSGGPISYSSNASGVCTVTPTGVITFVAGGTCSITAAQTGTATFTAAASITRSFMVQPGVNTVAFAQPADSVLTGAAPILKASSSSKLPVSYATSSASCTVSPAGTVTLVAPGPCAITASQAGNASFAAATPVTVTFAVTSGVNTITFPLPPNTPFGTTPPALTARATAGTVDYASNTPSVCTVTAGVLTYVSGGQCSITASQAGSTTYAAATPATQVFTVLPAFNTITFQQSLTVDLTNVGPTLVASSTSGQPVTFTSNATSICTVAGTSVTLVGAGTCSVTAFQSATASYAAPTSQTRTFQVTAGVNTINFSQPANSPFNVAPPTLVASASSGLAVAYVSTTTSVCTVTPATGILTLVSGGICSITVSQAGNASVAAALPVTRSFTVTPGANVITFPQPPATAFTSAPPALAATATSGAAVTYASNSSRICTVTPAGVIAFVAGGTCSLTASQEASVSWSAPASVTQTFAVVAGNNVISFTQPLNTPYTSPPPALVASATSGLPVSFSSTTPAICTVTTGGVLTFASGGLCSLTVAQPGNASFAAAASVTRAFTIQPGTNVITFVQPSNVTLDSASPRLVGTASSGLPVSFASLTPVVCAVSAQTVSLLSAGQCQVRATQAGNASYAVAASVDRSFTVGPHATTTGTTANATALVAPSNALTTGPTSPLAVLTTPTVVRLTAVPSAPLLGEPVVLFVEVSPVPDAGTVAFTDGGAALCSAAPLTAGKAQCAITFTTSGSHPLKATYSGSTNFAASESPVLNVGVTDQRLKTAAVAGKFMGRRGEMISSNASDGSRQIDRLAEAGLAGEGGPDAGLSDRQGAAAGSSRLNGPDGVEMARLRFGGRDASLAAARNSSLSEGRVPPFGGSSLGAQPDDEFGGGFGSGLASAVRLNGSTDSAMRLGFATSMRDMVKAANEADARKASESGLSLQVTPGVTSASRPNPFDIWIEGSYASFRDPTFSSNQDGHFGLLTVGADYVFNPRLLVGTFVQFDSMNQHSASERTDVKGRGWLAGPYATVRLTDNIYWQARAGWGTSSNEISPYLTYTDHFDTERWMISSTLSGRWMSGPWSLRPSASVSYLEDDAKSYTGTFGIIMPEVKTKLGQVKVGPEIGYRYHLDGGLVIEPHAGLQVIWKFANETTAAGLGPINGEAVGSSGMRGRAEFGLRATTRYGVSVGASGSYDGIGANGFEAITGTANVRVPLN
jgi:hypothetical protein